MEFPQQTLHASDCDADPFQHSSSASVIQIARSYMSVGGPLRTSVSVITMENTVRRCQSARLRASRSLQREVHSRENHAIKSDVCHGVTTMMQHVAAPCHVVTRRPAPVGCELASYLAHALQVSTTIASETASAVRFFLRAVKHSSFIELQLAKPWHDNLLEIRLVLHGVHCGLAVSEDRGRACGTAENPEQKKTRSRNEAPPCHRRTWPQLDLNLQLPSPSTKPLRQHPPLDFPTCLPKRSQRAFKVESCCLASRGTATILADRRAPQPRVCKALRPSG